jgi:hypothetical protein
MPSQELPLYAAESGEIGYLAVLAFWWGMALGLFGFGAQIRE